ncbi:MAG: helicase-exonuclease AddAB subunit AddA [Clostridia bacterium]|nr:helicase-exonuclease AddAB subunit AddA [Clostridia bacterium]
MKLTQAQSSAINVRDSSLIISAGAGSGKTAVLTERILTRICDENDNCNISDFLIVTFTNTAAKELSDRMRKKLTERAAECPWNKKIAQNIALLPLAKISTINSFCYEIVRNNFQKLGLSSSLRIGDEAEMNVIRQKLMNEVVDEAFEQMGDDITFLMAYETFSSAKNDGGFVDTLLNLHRLFTNIPDVDSYRQKVLKCYDEITKEEEFFNTFFGRRLYDETKQLLSKNVSLLDALIKSCKCDKALVDKYVPVLETEQDEARLVLNTLDEGYSATKALLDEYKPKSLAAVKNVENPQLKDKVKNAKNCICNSVKQLYNDYYTSTHELLKLAAKDTANVLSCLFMLVNRFEHKLSEKKQRSGIIEFSDAERYTLKLLVQSTEPFVVTDLAKSMREKFKEIYIDEYQDVNPLQDLIFKALSRVDQNGSEYTRFMVGDIKQSIYRFRGASPDIFLKYRESFCDIEGEGNNKRIFMNHNFRCSESVVDFSNYLFKKLMGEYYLDGDELIFARQEEIPVKLKTQLVISEYDKEITGKSVTADMLEAAIICDKIKEIVQNPKYCDSDGKMYSYKDIAVLARSKSALKTYESIFSIKGIPVFSDVGESFYGKKEILLCLCILQSIDNPMRDIPLAGYMRSFAARFTDDELCIIKNTFKKMKLYNSVKKYALNEDGKCDEALSKKCSEFISNLRELRDYARGKSASQLVWRIFTQMGLLNHCAHPDFTSDATSARRNLLKLYEMSLDFNKTSFRSVGSFVDYINASMKKDDIKAERIVGDECVRLMTVHASKGLEFPVCFVSDLARRFNKTDEKQYLVFSEKQGFACMLCDSPGALSTLSESNTVRITTPYKKLVSCDIDVQTFNEEIRILYVALTRARDMLIMTGVSPKKTEKLIEEAQTASFLGDFSSASSFLSLITSCIINDTSSIPLYLAAGLENPFDMKNELSNCFEASFVTCERAYALLTDSEHNESDAESEKDSCGIDDDYLKKIQALCDFKYENDIDAPAKLTVSMLKTGLIDEQMSDLENNEEQQDYIPNERKVVSLENSVQKKIPDFLSGKNQANAAEKGTAMHMFMQFANYEDCENMSGCENEAYRLAQMGFITHEQLKLLDFDRLFAFFNSDLYLEVKRSKKVYREQRFNLEVSAFDACYGESYDKDILVQGVIDLFFENDDGTYTVVDFKTDRVFGKDAEKELIQRHKSQLTYYCRAVSEMTGANVRSAVLYSFALNKKVAVQI